MVVEKKLDNGNEVAYDPIQKKEVKKYPRAVFLIIFNEFCERFSYSGMRAFLALYLKQKLLYSDDEATEVYHVFTTMAYFFAIIGAILADSFFGKFRTILYLMVVYAIGNIIITMGAVPTMGLPAREMTMVGLIMVALGTGGIKPCVASFGGDQFVLPEQEKQLSSFFSMLYFILYTGSLIAKFGSPLLRSEVQCFGDKDCFAVAFGAPGILIITSIIIFAAGKKLYVIKKPTENIITETCKCIYESIRSRKAMKREGKKYDHWLDYARGSFDQKFINDLKRTLRVFLLFTPLPVFWSLLDQMVICMFQLLQTASSVYKRLQGSRWTLQATKMDGRFWFYTVKPDQMQVMSPISLIILIPVFKKVIYPFCAKFGMLTKSLTRLQAACILAAMAFISTGLLEIKLEKTYPVLPSDGLGQLRIFNGYNCEMHFKNRFTGDSFLVEPLQMYADKIIQVERNLNVLYNRTLVCPDYNQTWLEKIHIEENKAVSYFYRDSELAGNSTVVRYQDCNNKSRSGLPFVRVLANIPNQTNLEILLKNTDKNIIELRTNSTFTELVEVFAGDYQLYINSQLVPLYMDLQIGGVYTIIINYIDGFNAKLVTVTEPNSVSMLWVLPQVIIISAGEIMFAITGVEFAFKEAPESMKAVLQAYWLFIEAIGNILIIIVTRVGSGYRQVYHFFFFSCLMFVAMILFYFLTKRHERYAELSDECQDQEPTIDQKHIVISNKKYIEVMQIDDTLDH